MPSLTLGKMILSNRMSAWRKKAIDCLPHLKKQFEHPGTSIYTVFFEILPVVVLAHQLNNHQQLTDIYSFAEWCISNKDEDISNAAAVAFYEHLGDYPETLSAMPLWVKPDIYKQIRGLLERRTTHANLQTLDVNYGLKGKWQKTR